MTPSIKDKFNKEIRDFYRGFSNAEAFGTMLFFIIVLWLAWFFTRGFPESRLLILHPRTISSIPAIFTSNFFHLSFPHLFGNLLFFVPLGFLVLKFEGLRGMLGILTGMLIGGFVVWWFGTEGTVYGGFSRAVMACWGILFVWVIRQSLPLTVGFLILSYFFMEFSLFETIRPTAHTASNNISWLGHLGGLIGGMAYQVRSLAIALEMLYKADKVSEEEFMAISVRIHDNKSAQTEDEILDVEKPE
ncbi:MAG: rhomboid family intramembrane serine protease [bacterium]